MKVDQPDLGLPLSMYLEESSYTDYIAAYKQFIVDIALVVVSAPYSCNARQTSILKLNTHFTSKGKSSIKKCNTFRLAMVSFVQ